ncbi:heterokaryon incompatibility protein-domain-containing protein, partial [Ganoderma leucocontextum]
MRLLDTYTGQFVEKDPGDTHTQYAILSHTWDQDGEQSYKQLKKIQKRHPLKAQAPFTGKRDSERLLPGPIWKDPELSRKIRDACAYARADGFRYIWIDSCCIDKTSSSELSEAINSMYAWYGRADVCYAYLADVPTDSDHRKDGSRFSRSRWFTRGWTLQELLAPPHVVFLSRDWKPLGSKLALVELVHRTTNISPEALLEPQSLDTFSVAQRLSWAAKRETTRAEDRAYSLLGLFDINMPILYGEGERAFRRLQEEIMRRIPDQSLFAWLDARRLVCPQAALDEPAVTPETSDQDERREVWVCQETQPRHVHSLLALSLDGFEKSGRLTAIPYDEVFQRLPGRRLHLPAPDYAFTPLGIRTQVPVIPFSHILPPNVTNAPGNLPLSQSYLVILGCEHKDHPGCLLGRICCIPPSTSGVEFLYCGFIEVPGDPPENGWRNKYIELFPLSPSTIARRTSSSRRYTSAIPTGPARCSRARATVHTRRSTCCSAR